ncbi:MAG: D-lyxose/D-mannose family sugar isomerase [Anaerolineae bacterium]
MKRSEINAYIRHADDFIRAHGFHLPPWAHWTPDEWRTKGPEVREIVERKLGWDVTDFGSNHFEQTGLLLFTVRNGNVKDPNSKQYAEKIMLVGVDQVTPMHFHWHKTEDIINRGGGQLVIQLFNSTPAEGLADTEVTISTDGVQRCAKAGDTVVLNPGESITLPAYCYHKFWGANSTVLVGEVSAVNDDDTDNRFLETLPRFAEIDEDEPPYRLLCNEYSKYYRG